MNSIDETPWSIMDSTDLYRVADWSDRFFHINDDGHAAVRTARTQIDSETDSIDIDTVVRDLRSRGVLMPCLLRFHDVLRARVERVNLAFAQAIDESGYSGSYRGVCQSESWSAARLGRSPIATVANGSRLPASLGRRALYRRRSRFECCDSSRQSPWTVR